MSTIDEKLDIIINLLQKTGTHRQSPGIDPTLSSQIEMLVVRAPAGSSNKPLKLEDLIRALDWYQHKNKLNAQYTNRAISRTVKQLFEATSRPSNSQTIFPGLMLKPASDPIYK